MQAAQTCLDGLGGAAKHARLANRRLLHTRLRDWSNCQHIDACTPHDVERCQRSGLSLTISRATCKGLASTDIPTDEKASKVFAIMSISDNSTVAVSHDNDGQFKFDDEWGHNVNENADIFGTRHSYVARFAC